MGKLVCLYFLTTYREEWLVGKLMNFRLLTPPATVASSPPIQKSGSWGSAHTIVSGPSPSFLTACDHCGMRRVGRARRGGTGAARREPRARCTWARARGLGAVGGECAHALVQTHAARALRGWVRSGLNPPPPGKFFTSAGYRLQFWPRGVGSTACPSAHTAGPALERAATSISGSRAARALAGGTERLEPTSSRIILRLRRLSVAVLAEGGWVDSVPLATRQG